jgi:hypothetical protein
MNRALVLTSACLILTSLTGCSADPRDQEIKKAVAVLGEAGTYVKNITDGVKEAVKKAQADPEKKERTEADLKSSFDAIENLKLLGNKLQAIKSKVDSFADLPTDNQKEVLVKENKGPLESNLERLDNEQRQLEIVLRDSTPFIQREAMTALRSKLKEAEEKYLVIGQR